MAPTKHVRAPQPSLHTRFLCAFVQVPVSLLDFEGRGNWPREIDDRIKSRLGETFSQIFEPEVPDNHVSGVVTEAELKNIVRELHTTKEQLKNSLYSGIYPFMQNTRIWCPADRHRVEAATEKFGDDTCWVVQLHCPPDDLPQAIYDELIRTLSERYSPRYNYSDGEIFRRIRQYEFTRPELVEGWLARLSTSKKISLNILYNDVKRGKKNWAVGEGSPKAVLEMFDDLLVFPGLWEGLELGNLHKHLALRCNHEITRFLRHVCDTWDYITGADPEIQRCVDINTARNLQSLAPAASIADRSLICALIDERRVFSGVQNPLKREQIKQRILDTPVIIPSIKSFHENMKLFSIAARITRSYLLPDRTRTSLVEALREIWKPPGTCFVEFQEGQFQAINSAPSFALAYKQIFLAAMRNFSELSDETPKIDPGDKIRAVIRQSTVSQFYRRAVLLGFWSEAMQERSVRNERTSEAGSATVFQGPADVEATRIDRRWGRPYVRIYRQMKRVAFLPLLQGGTLRSTFPTVAYIQQDFIRSFLGASECDLNPSDQIASICDVAQERLESIEEESINDLDMAGANTENETNCPAGGSGQDIVMVDHHQDLQSTDTEAQMNVDAPVPSGQDTPMRDAEEICVTDHSLAVGSRLGRDSINGDGIDDVNFTTPSCVDNQPEVPSSTPRRQIASPYTLGHQVSEVRSQAPSISGSYFDPHSSQLERSQVPSVNWGGEELGTNTTPSSIPSEHRSFWGSEPQVPTTFSTKELNDLHQENFARWQGQLRGEKIPQERESLSHAIISSPCTGSGSGPPLAAPYFSYPTTHAVGVRSQARSQVPSLYDGNHGVQQMLPMDLWLHETAREGMPYRHATPSALSDPTPTYGQSSPRSQVPSLITPEFTDHHTGLVEDFDPLGYPGTDKPPTQVRSNFVENATTAAFTEFKPPNPTLQRNELEERDRQLYISEIPWYINHAGISQTEFWSHPPSEERSVAPTPNFIQRRPDHSPNDSMATIDLASSPIWIDNTENWQPGIYAASYQTNRFSAVSNETEGTRTIVHTPQRFSSLNGFRNSGDDYWNQ